MADMCKENIQIDDIKVMGELVPESLKKSHKRRILQAINLIKQNM